MLKPFADTNIIIAITNNQRNCFADGNGNFLEKERKPINKIPAINCLIYAICKGGSSRTPILLTTHVVPQIKLVAMSAKYPLVFDECNK